MFDVNEYFDGHVKSIAFAGEKLATTVGVMAPGEYEFSTSQQEVMKVVVGELTVLLPDSDSWQSFSIGETFSVAAGVSFKVKLKQNTVYLCTYE